MYSNTYIGITVSWVPKKTTTDFFFPASELEGDFDPPLCHGVKGIIIPP